MEFILRRAVKADESAINRLFIEMLNTIYGWEDSEGYKEGDLDYYFSGGDDWICAAEADGEIVGFLSIEVHREEHDYLYYDDFSVSGKFRGHGIGSAMLDRGEEFCRSIGFGAIVLHVEKGNVSARRMYEKRGFEILRDDGDRLCLIKHMN